MLKSLSNRLHSVKLIGCLITLLVTCGGCAFIKLQNNINELNQLGTLHGQIVANAPVTAPIIIALIKEAPHNPQLVNYIIQQQPGEFSMLVKPGKYNLFAWEDLNRDKKYQGNERIAKSALLTITAGAKLSDIILKLPDSPDAKIMETIKELRKTGSIKLNAAKRNLGKIVTIDEQYFSQANASMGMWEPVRFLKEVPFGLFLLQHYDPNKIPVLFVHGIDGSPKNFKYLIQKLDQTKFQPWIFYYPTGLRLRLVGKFLNDSVNELLVKYQIKKIYVVAHSMGGLVARSFINYQLKNNQPSAVKLFISISTPWQGHKMAKFGVDNAPVIMPVWYDMAPDSKFLKKLYTNKLPKNLPYYLLFSYKGGSNSAGETNDGAVTLASMLRLDAQRAAVLVRGFNESHTSILKNKNVSSLINKILSAR